MVNYGIFQCIGQRLSANATGNTNDTRSPIVIRPFRQAAGRVKNMLHAV
jgi:hypothetical protein